MPHSPMCGRRRQKVKERKEAIAEEAVALAESEDWKTHLR